MPQQIEESCIKVERRLYDTMPEVEGISQGYMEARLCGEALTRHKKQMLAVNEDFMRHLEELDSISFSVRPKVKNKYYVLHFSCLNLNF